MATVESGPLEITYEDVHVRAMVPPQVLLDMRHVWNGLVPENRAQAAAKQMMDGEAGKFFDRLSRLEEKWRKQVIELTQARAALVQPAAAAVQEEPEEDGETTRVSELVDRLLGELEQS